MQFLTITELRKQFSRLERTFLRTKEDVVVVTRYGKPELVIKLHNADTKVPYEEIARTMLNLLNKHRKVKLR